MSKKNCIVNGKEFPIDNMGFHLEELVEKFIKDKKTRVAVAVNNKIIFKSEWRKKRIFNGDIIEIVQPFFGG
jgi:thiamine biosynthesis protein ThiS